MKLYEQLAGDVARMIESGVLRPGERLPSVRALHARRALSPSTVLQAYTLLEARGLIESRPRSGYYARQYRPVETAQSASTAPAEGVPVDVSDLVFEILGATREQRLLPFGSAFPSPLLFPLDDLARALTRSTRKLDPWTTVADLPPGSLSLRREIAKRYLALGAEVPVDGILVTNGAMEALNLSLQCVAPAGSLIAIESPAFYGALQAIERLGLRAIEVHTDPVSGVSPQSLREVLERHSVRACWFMSNFHNPLGALVPETHRSQIVAMLAERQIPLIEDDVYAELYFGPRPPRPFKAWDRAGLVLHCGSFSKCLAPGYRVGWVAAGRFAKPLERLKMMSTLATSIPAQEGIAEYLRRGGYDHHLRRLRPSLARQQGEMLEAIARHFPPGTSATRAAGGYFTWVELPLEIDALDLHRLAAAEGIGLSPGPMFSPARAYRHCIRLNYGHPWTQELRAGIARVGSLASELMNASRKQCAIRR